MRKKDRKKEREERVGPCPVADAGELLTSKDTEGKKNVTETAKHKSESPL
jgi:hypothetical protein